VVTASAAVVVHRFPHPQHLLGCAAIDKQMGVYLSARQQLRRVEVVHGAYASQEGSDERELEVEIPTLELSQGIQALQGHLVILSEYPRPSTYVTLAVLLADRRRATLSNHSGNTHADALVYVQAVVVESEKLDVVLVALGGIALHLVQCTPSLGHIVQLDHVAHA